MADIQHKRRLCDQPSHAPLGQIPGTADCFKDDFRADVKRPFQSVDLNAVTDSLCCALQSLPRS